MSETETRIQALLQAALDNNQQVEAIRLALKLGDRRFASGKFERALDNFTLSTRLCREAMDDTCLTESIYKLAETYLMLKQADKALLRVKRSLELSEPERDAFWIARLWALLGDIHQSQGKLDEAQVDYTQAAKRLQDTEQWAEAGLALGKQATLLMDSEENQKATVLFAQSITLFEKAGRPELKMRGLGNLGTAFGKLGRWKEAGKRHNLAMKLARQLKDREEEAFQLSNLGYVAEMDGEIEWAVRFYQQGLYVAILEDIRRMAADLSFDLARLLMADNRHIPQVIVLLEAVLGVTPKHETAAAMLREARQRQIMLTAQGVPMMPAVNDLRLWSSRAYDG